MRKSEAYARAGIILPASGKKKPASVKKTLVKVIFQIRSKKQALEIDAPLI